jgi:hypothetical protein
MHKTDFAPVLSATSNLDSVWIISSSQLVPRLKTPNGLQKLDQSWARHLHSKPFAACLFGRDFPAFRKAEPAIVPQFLGLPLGRRIFLLSWSSQYQSESNQSAKV